MGNTYLLNAGLLRWLALGCLLVQPIAAIEQFRARRSRDWDERASEGRCAVRVWVDDEVNVFLEGDLVTFETVRGREARDAGTECSQPLPRGQSLLDFQFRGIDGRGQVELIKAPERRNGYRAWVRIRDPRGGGEEHHFRLMWRQNWTGYGNRSSGRAVDREPGRAGDGEVCFYRDRDFRGEPFCARSGESVRNVGPQWNDRFRSIRFLGGVRSVEVYQDENFAGASMLIERDEPDLGRVSRGGMSFDRAITSFRVR